KEKITTSYSSGACSYIVKPTNFSTFGEKLRALGQYWGFASEVPELAAEVPELASEVPELAARRDHA
ncbi:MAG: hypothetical protein KAY24_15890, partial [Candidatus Eisenbacteria sp.]|nr:hypothetical protein [Candidatus Eisenbacteria bacterium]